MALRWKIKSVVQLCLFCVIENSILKMKYPKSFVLVILLVLWPAADVSAQKADESLLTVAQITASNEFSPASGKQIQWHEGGGGYTTLEASDGESGGVDIVLHNLSEDTRTVLVESSQLVPDGTSNPLSIHGYSWSADQQKMLVYTNSKRVWRANTRGDYWVLDLQDNSLKQLGATLPASSLMFAKFSPDGSRVAYVSKNNIYVQDLATGELDPHLDQKR